jgi:hypothetical protein
MLFKDKEMIIRMGIAHIKPHKELCTQFDLNNYKSLMNKATIKNKFLSHINGKELHNKVKSSLAHILKITIQLE